MPTEKVRPSENVKVMNDIDWCKKNLAILNFTLYQQTFKFGSESNARRRYGDILASKKVCGSEERDKLIKEFNEYKHNNDCTLSEAKNLLNRSVAGNYEDGAHADSQTKKTIFIGLDKDDEKNYEPGLVGGDNNLASECDEEEGGSGLLDDDSYLAPGSEDEREHYYSSGGDDEPKSDLSILCHEGRSGEYNLIVEGNDNDVEEEDLDVMLVPWLVGEINIIEKCEQYATRTLERIEFLKSMSDTRIL